MHGLEVDKTTFDELKPCIARMERGRVGSGLSLSLLPTSAGIVGSYMYKEKSLF